MNGFLAGMWGGGVEVVVEGVRSLLGMDCLRGVGRVGGFGFFTLLYRASGFCLID